MFIDAHCHLADPKLFSRIDEIILLSKKQGVTGFIQGGVDPQDWIKQLNLVLKFPKMIFPCFGLHPWYVSAKAATAEGCAQVEKDLARLPSFLSQGVGLGEIGIDLGPKADAKSLEFQTRIFREQLMLAKSSHKPVILHIVRAHDQAVEVLERVGILPEGGIVHAFSGNAAAAKQYIKMGLKLSVGAAAVNRGYETFKRGLEKISLDDIVIESDSPDQVPTNYPAIEAGLNDPRSILFIAAGVCQIKGLTPDKAKEVLLGSRERLVQIFKLELPEITP